MKACPFCQGRATKLLSLTTGLLTCQQCGKVCEHPALKEAVASAVKKAGEELERRLIHGEGIETPVGLLGQSPISGFSEEGTKRLLRAVFDLEEPPRGRLRVVCNRGCAAPRRDPEQEHPGMCVCGGYLDDIEEEQASALEVDRRCDSCGCPAEAHPYDEWSDRSGRTRCSVVGCSCRGYRFDYTEALRRKLLQASNAVARPASSKQGLSIRVARADETNPPTRGAIGPGATTKSPASVSRPAPSRHHRRRRSGGGHSSGS